MEKKNKNYQQQDTVPVIKNIIKHNDENLSFLMENANPSIANTIRIFMHDSIDTLSMISNPYENSTIKIFQNDLTNITNEQFSDLLQQIPLNFTSQQINDFDEKTSNILLKLDIYNTDSTPKIITTRDISIFIDDQRQDQEFIEHIFQARPDPLEIGILQQGQRLHFQSTLQKGNGSKNACFKHITTQTYFRNKPQNILADQILQKKIQDEQKQAIEQNQHFNAQKFITDFNTLDRFQYFQKNKYQEACQIEFFINTIGTFSPLYIITQSLKNIIETLKQVQNDLEVNLRQIQSDSQNLTQEFNLKITSCIGFLIQNLIAKKIVSQEIDFVMSGQQDPTQSKGQPCLRIISKFKSQQKQDIITLLNQIITDCRQIMVNILSQF